MSRPKLTKTQTQISKNKRTVYIKQWHLNNPRNTEQKLWYAARKRAKNNNLKCTITKEDIIIPKTCPYLGITLQIDNRKRKTIRDAWPTLDRIDNTKGYTPDNIEVISWLANTMKNKASISQLKVFAKKIKDLYGD